MHWEESNHLHECVSHYHSTTKITLKTDYDLKSHLSYGCYSPLKEQGFIEERAKIIAQSMLI